MSEMEDDILMVYLNLRREVDEVLKPRLLARDLEIAALNEVWRAFDAWLNAVPPEVYDLLPDAKTTARLMQAIHNVEKLSPGPGPA